MPPAGFPDEDALQLADELSRRGPAQEEIGTVRKVAVRALLKAFRKRRDKDGTSFAVDNEAPLYLKAATTLASRDFDVVVFGHTHHVKRVPLKRNGRKDATYLNTGTWADLMRIPASIYEGEDDVAEVALADWITDLENNRIDQYRRLVATFARIDMEGDEIVAKDVFFFDGPAEVKSVSTDGVLTRLGLKEQS